MSKQMNEDELATFAEQFAALWNESDAAARDKRIREFFAPTAVQVLVDPPVEMREQVQRLQFAMPALEVRGYEALSHRVTRAFELFVASGEYEFAVPAPAIPLPAGLVGLSWVMVAKADGAIAGGGFDVLGLDDDGRVLTDHQFIEGVR
ncbi:hypothetical protein F5X71_06510 [Nocardia brasiliensis]|uniref:SnoaL-like domain-containing protein n=1 Tax=Nocardia brasiliensis TaxID=37326 RepID=A0A6G9XM39_NOCBR|nr:hypothetical protein [Nocardia brasiliensis]QIS02011.1 hypothetical protein F5X71_06510 [Nocardia brasiliensis]